MGKAGVVAGVVAAAAVGLVARSYTVGGRVEEGFRASLAGVDEARLQAAVRGAVDARIDGLTGRGLLVQGESALSLALQYHDGAISINGKPAEPRELGELGLPF